MRVSVAKFKFIEIVYQFHSLNFSINCYELDVEYMIDKKDSYIHSDKIFHDYREI